jgi:transposase-like protein
MSESGARDYLYRAVDKQGLTVDLPLSGKRGIAAAKRFFTRAIERHGAPERVTLDGYPATHSALAELKERGVSRPRVRVRTSKYMNSLVEQDHRRVKQRLYPMLGFKNFGNAAVTIGGAEPVRGMGKGGSTSRS